MSVAEVVGHVSPAQLRQFVKLHLRQLKTIRAMLYRFGDCAQHPAGFAIFGQLAQLRIFFIIILVFPFLPIVWNCKLAETISNGVQHLLKCCFRLSGCQSRLFRISHIFLLLVNCCLCVFNLLSCHSGLSILMILNQFLLLSLLEKCVSRRLPTPTFFLDRKLCIAARARTLAASKPLLPSVARWHCPVESYDDLPDLPTGSGERFYFVALTIIFCVGFVDGQDIGCWKIWNA